MMKTKVSKTPTAVYSKEARLAALKTLAANNYNYSLTEKQLKITRKTLHKWQDELSDDPEVKKNQADVINTVTDAVMRTKSDLIQKIEEVNFKALNKALELIDKAKDLDKIGRILETLKEINDNPEGRKQDPLKNKRMTIAERIERITNIGNE